jgi:hypothetical protein
MSEPRAASLRSTQALHARADTELAQDNISALCRTGVENDAESWALMNDWLIGMRRRGKTTVLVHHAGKSGKQRGSQRERTR